MRLGRPIPELILNPEEHETLQRWARRPKSAQALALRACVILACAAGKTNTQVSAELRLSQPAVGKWRSRFVARRLEGLLDEPRPGAPRRISDAAVERVLTLTLETHPRDATHWSTRAMARRCGLSQSAVSRIWRAFALQPHRAETFQLSKDPLFIEKVRDIVGLYLHPPDKALVLCVDEKTQMQALDRSQPPLPMRPGQAERRTHDYVRHGTTSLFAALEVKSGRVVGDFHADSAWVLSSAKFAKFENPTANSEAPAIARACNWFITEVRKRTSLCRCLTNCRTSRSWGDGTQIRGNLSRSSRSRICTASRESVFCFRTIAARISAASPTHSSCLSSASIRPNH